MFQLEITSIQQDIQYHEQELELAKARLENMQVATEYSTTAIASIEDCLTHIEPSFLGILKDRIDQMFSDNSKSNQIGLEQLDPQEVKEETPQEMCSKEQEEPQPEKTEEKEEVQTPNIEKIDGQLYYNHVDSICYVAGKSKGRLNNYGVYLTKILDIAEKYTVSNKPTFFETKYELRIEGISFNDAFHLQNFNLLKEYNDSKNNGARKVWSNRIREVEPAYKPLPKTIALEDVELGAIVTSDPTKLKDKQYKVIQKVKMGGIDHIECICIYHREMPTLVGNTDYLKDIYPVDLMEIRIDPSFSCVEESGARFEQPEEEVLTEDVQIYVPKEPKKEYKPVLSKAKRETPLVELTAGDAVHRKIGDSIYEVVGMARHENKLVAECKLISSTTRSNSIGNSYFFDSGVYLCEEEVVVAA